MPKKLQWDKVQDDIDEAWEIAKENLRKYLGHGWDASDLARAAAAYGQMLEGHALLGTYLTPPVPEDD